MTTLRPENDGIPKTDIIDNPLEEEIHSPQRVRHGHPSHTEINHLTAAEERSRVRRMKGSKAKKYDGRSRGKSSGTASLPRVREALENFYKEIELPELKKALELSNDPKYQLLLAALNDPRFHDCSFSTLCKKCRMSLQDVVEIWRNHLRVKGLVRMMSHLPDIMEDVAIDSKSRVVPCPQCQGKGKLFDKETNRKKDPICPECHGDGTIRLLGDKDARLLAFETVGLKKAGGINQTVNVTAQMGTPTMEDQISEIDRVFDAEYTTIGEDTNGQQPFNNGTDRNEGATEATGGESNVVGNSVGAPTADSDETENDPTDYK